MNTQDNAQVMAAIEKCTIFNYLDKLLAAKMHKVTLFSTFPVTAAANFSDPHYFILVDNPADLLALNCGRFFN